MTFTLLMILAIAASIPVYEIAISIWAACVDKGDQQVWG